MKTSLSACNLFYSAPSAWRLVTKAILIALTALLVPAFLSEESSGTTVRFSTVLGDFDVDLFDQEAPNTVANFLNYVARGDYDDSIVHRSVPDFVIQGGGFTVGPHATFPATFPGEVPEDPPVANEFSISNTRGTLAMARFADPDSATSQWFINLADNSANLDNQNEGFTVFGEVDDMTVVDAIAALEVFDLRGFHFAFENVPMIDDELELRNLVIVESITVVPKPTNPSDLTGDNFVDFDDLTILLAHWDQEVSAGQGNLVDPLTTAINFQDLTFLLADWTGPGPVGSPEAASGEAAVPEPSGLALALVASLGVCCWRRRRRAF